MSEQAYYTLLSIPLSSFFYFLTLWLSMPHIPHSSSRSHKAEVKFNVTTECKPSLILILFFTFSSVFLSPIVPHLGLHAAAATGNIGLAKYALTHGQPINSVIDGVLPLHAACSGGNDIVVRLLIDNGADVNAPRYSTAHSTPSHFYPSLLILVYHF